MLNAFGIIFLPQDFLQEELVYYVLLLVFVLYSRFEVRF